MRAKTRAALAVSLVVTACSVDSAGLRPEYPDVSEHYVAVDSLQPTFRWAAFEPPPDLQRATGKTGTGVSDITYEVKIWRAGEDHYPLELAYRRVGIAEPSHRIAIRLEPGTEYVWSVRSRFTSDGMARVSEWGVITEGGCHTRRLMSLIPSTCYYRFKTPAT